MKKFIIICLMFIAGMILVGCDTEKVLSEAYNNLQIPGNLSEVTDDLELITQLGDVVITWESKNEGVILPTGEVTRRDGVRVVQLLATLSYKEKTKVKVFEVTVLGKGDIPIKPEPPRPDEAELKADYQQWFSQIFSFEYITEDLDLPTSHPNYEDEILWETSDANIISNDGRITQTDVDQEATLTAHIRVNGFEFTIDINIIVLAEGYNFDTDPINEIRKKPLNTIVEVSGVVTEISSDGLYIQDNTGAIHVYLRAGSDYLDIVYEGSLVKVTGKVGNFNGLVQVSDISNVEVIKESVRPPGIITIDSFDDGVLAPLESMKVRFDNAKLITLPQLVSGKDNTIEVSLNGVRLKLFIKKHIDGSIIDELNNKLSYYAAGEEITINSVMVGIYQEQYQFIVTEADNIADKNISTEEKYVAVKQELASLFNLHNKDISRRIEFISKSVFKSEVMYEFSHPQILSVGVFNRQDQDVTVTVIVTIKIDDMIYTEEPIIITVLAKSATPNPIDELSEYYRAAEGKSGSSLKTTLRDIITSNYKSIGYSQTSYIIEDSDAHPENNNLLLLIYNRKTANAVWDNAKTWNKEHVWPKSKLGNASKSDIHNLRASNPTVNGDRGNDPFASGSGGFGKVSGGWYPGDDDKGDVARIVLYMHVRWGLNITKSTIGEIQMFIQWHFEDPVDEFEIHRNEIIFQNQRNRNPFIDYPQFVELIWPEYVPSTFMSTLNAEIINGEVMVKANPTLEVFNLNEQIKTTFALRLESPIYVMLTRREEI